MIIIDIDGAPHPKAHIHSIDLDSGAIAFRWLDSEEQPVDSGGSLARFTPGESLPDAAAIEVAILLSTS